MPLLMSAFTPKANIGPQSLHVRFGSLTGIVQRCRHVCFTSQKSGYVQRTSPSPLSANGGHARARLKCLTIGNPCVMSLTLRSGGCTNMHREQRAQRTHETASEVFGGGFH